MDLRDCSGIPTRIGYIAFCVVALMTKLQGLRRPSKPHFPAKPHQADSLSPGSLRAGVRERMGIWIEDGKVVVRRGAGEGRRREGRRKEKGKPFFSRKFFKFK